MKLKRILAIVLCVAMVLSTMSFSAFAEEPSTPDSGYFLYIYNADGTVGMEIDGTKSASDFCLRTAIEDARVFVDNAFLFGIITPATYVVEMYGDSVEDESFEIGSDVTINGNGHNIILEEGVELTNNGTINNATVVEKSSEPEVPTLADYVVFPDGMTAANYVELFGDNTITDGENYYANIIAALNGIHLKDERVLYCKPGANVGTMTHGHVCDNLTIYGNGAKLEAAGEQDFALDTYKYANNNEACSGVTAELTLNVKYLDGCGAWGQRTTDNTLNIVFENCKDMNRVYFSGTTGINNITLTDCSFLGSVENRCTLYSNNNGTIAVDGCEFANVYAPINLNHKIAGTQNITISDTSFDNCGYVDYDYAAPVRVLSSVEGAESVLSVSGCTFTNTVTNKVGQDADILLDYGVGTTTLDIAETAANVTVETENNVGEETDVAADETKSFSNVVPTSLSYAQFSELVRTAEGGVYDGNDITVVLKDSERSYQNNKTAQFFIGATNVNITDPVETVKVSNVNFIFEDDDATNTYTSGELQVFAKNIEFTDCTFTGVAVSPWGVSNTENAETATFTDCEWKDLSGRYGIHQNRASALTVTGCDFINCERGIHTNSSTVSSITITGNTFTGIGDGYGVLCLAENNGDLSKATLNISGNTAEGQVMLRQLSGTVTYKQVSDILDTNNNTYGAAYVSGSIEPAAPAVAEVNGVEYSTLAEAMSAAQNGDTVTLLDDIVVDTETYTIADGKAITLNMNGKKITVTENKNGTNATANYELFYIYGEMTVTGEGTIELTSIYDRDWNAMAAIFHNRGGVLTIKNGTYKNLGGTDMAWVVDNSGNYYGDAVTNIEGGTLESTYTAIRNRMEQNSHGASGTAILNISGGTISGTKRAVWAQAASTSTTSPATGEINVTGGNIGLINTACSAGAVCMTTISAGSVSSFEGEVGELTVTGGTIGDVTMMNAAGETVKYTITEDGKYIEAVAEINGVKYSTLAEAIAAAQDGDTVEIYAGEYDPINISNKNITIKGTVGDDGELLTTIKGGNPAITGHSFNGTIKDIKIVDAWKVMYAEPAGNVTVDNVYVTGATYGFHLIAYSEGLTWTIQNSYMDLAWANSFGVANDGYSDIIIKGNRFETTNPYYPDYGAIHVNSFLPSVTVEENIFGENAKIYIDASVTDTSKINISKNYHADGVENAFADDAEGVTVPIYKYYTEVDEDGKLTGLVEIPATVNGVGYETLEAAIAAAQDGDTVTLLSDVEIEKSISFTKDITLTIDGAGFSIKPAEGSTETNSAFNFGQGTNATVANKNYTIKNIVFDGWTTDHVLRLQGVEATVENCKFINCNQPDGFGLLTLTYCKATVEDCVFENNTCVRAIDVNSNAAADATNATEIKNCTFKNNNCIGPAGVIEAYEGAFTIKDSKFVDNTAVSASIFCATNADISGNYFAENTYTGTKGNEASVLAGPWVEGTYAIEINDNAFTDASVPGAFVEDWSADYDVTATYNLNSNYWNGEEPNYGVSGEPEITLENYYTTYDNNTLGGFTTVAPAGLSGSGTEEDPYMINSVEELEFFRASVNAGEETYNAAGVWVALGADVNLEGIVWTDAIGDGVVDYYGNFDGNGYAVKNLTVKKDSYTYYQCAALFGSVCGPVIMRDVVIENPTMICDYESTSTNYGMCVASLIGFAWNCQGAVVENITVKGDIAINVPKASGVGGIVGYAYNPLEITNCKVIGSDGSYIEAISQVGGIIGYCQYGATTITDCSVENITITSRGYMGGIAGVVQTGNVISGCTVKDVAMVVTTESSAACVGSAYGAVSGTTTVSNHTTLDTTVTYVDNTTKAASTVGGGYSSKEVSEARVGDVYYETLEKALAAAPAGATIEMIVPLTIAQGEEMSIDLKGRTIVYTSTTQGEAMITNKGTLTINDSVGGGVINYDYVGAADSSYGKGNYTISNAGTLTVNGGKITIANLSRHAKYPIDNNSTTGNAVLVINDGHLYNYNTSAIRQFCNSTVYENSVTINGGLIEGYSAIWVQNPGSKTVNGKLTITGGEIRTTAKAYVEGTATLEEVGSNIYCTVDGVGGAWSDASSVTITGGTFNENVYLAEEAPVAEVGEGATFNGRLELPAVYVAQIGDNKYETLQAAVDAAQAGDTIELLADVEIANNDAYAVVIKKSITIDGKGHSISQADGYTNQWALLYFQDASLVTVKNLTFDGVKGGAAIWAIRTDVVVENCVFQNGEHTQIQGIVRMTAGDATIKDSKFLNNSCSMAISFNFDLDSAEPSVDALKIQNCEFTGNTCSDTAVIYYVKGASSEISDSTFTNNTVDTTSHGAIAYYSEGANGVVKGNVFSNNTIKAASARAGILALEAGTTATENAFISNNISSTASGTTYVGTVLNKADSDSDGITVNGNYWGGSEPDVANVKGAPTALDNYYKTYENGVLGGLVELIEPVAQIGDNKYETLEDAINAAQVGDTLELLSDVSVDAKITIPYDLTIDGNGYTLTYTGSDRAIDVPDTANGANVTINDLTVDCTSSYCQRGINYNATGTLTLNNVTVKGENVSYGINLPGKSIGATVNITDSVVSGCIALNIWGANSNITVTDSVLTSVDKSTVEGYAAIALNDDGSMSAAGTTLTINGGVINALNENGDFSKAVRNASIGIVTISESTIVNGIIDDEKSVATVRYGDANEFYAYTSLKAAVNKAMTDVAAGLNARVELLSDVEVTEDLTISGIQVVAGDYTITNKATLIVDGGAVITGTPKTAEAYAVIINKGTLTVDGDDTTIAVNHAIAGSTSYAVNAITNAGTLTVNGGTIENTSTSTNQIGYAIDNNSGTANAIVTINGGEVKASGSYYYDGIRQFANSVTNENMVTVAGGSVSSIWLQNPSDGADSRNTKDVKGGVAVTDGNISSIYLEPSTSFTADVTGGTIGSLSYFEKDSENADRNLTGFVSGGTFTTKPDDAFAAEDYEFEANQDGTYGVVEAIKVAQVGEVKYSSLQEAVNAGGTVILLADVEVSEEIVIAADKTVVLDLNGYTVSHTQTETATANSQLIKNLGNLTVKDSSVEQTGKLSYTYTGEKAAYSVSTISNALATLTVESGTIENNTTSDYTGASGVYAYAIDSLTNGSGGEATVTVNGGVIKSNYMAIRQFVNSTTDNNTLVVTDGEIVGGTRAINVQGSNDATKASNTAVVNISGGTVKAVSETGYSVCALSSSENMSITDGTFIGNIYSGAMGIISGGTYNIEPYAGYAVEGYEFVANEDGTYGVAIAKEPSGEVAYRAYVTDASDREAVGVDLLNVYAEETFVVILKDAAGNVLTTTTYKNGGVEAAEFTANIVLSGRASSSWDTVISATLTEDNAPETIEVWADGVLVDTYENALGKDTNVNEYDKYIALDCVAKKIKVAGTTMTLGNSLSMNFFVAAADCKDASYAKVVKSYADGRADTEIEIPYSQWRTSGSYKVFSYSGVAAKEMCDTYEATIYNAEGVAISKTFTTSIQEYAMGVLNKGTYGPEDCTLMVDMLNYGAAAQTQFNYATDNLANAQLTDAQKELATQSIEYSEVTLSKTENFAGTTIILESNIMLNLWFTNVKDSMTAVVEFTDSYGNAKTINVAANEIITNGRYKIVAVDQLAVADYKSVVTCTIYDGDQVFASAQQSVEQYLKRMDETDSSNALYEKIMKFGIASYEYLH